jgi:hypothetical protein
LSGQADGEELVVFGALFGDYLYHRFQRDKVADVIEEPVFGKRPWMRSSYSRCVGLYVMAIDRLPGSIPFFIRGPRAMEGSNSIGDNDQGVVVEELESQV